MWNGSVRQTVCLGLPGFHPSHPQRSPARVRSMSYPPVLLHWPSLMLLSCGIRVDAKFRNLVSAKVGQNYRARKALAGPTCKIAGCIVLGGLLAAEAAP